MNSTRASTGQAPRLGRLHRLLGPFYFTGVFWYRLLLLAARVLPEPLVRPLVFSFSLLFFVALGSVRRAVGNNLEVVLGEAGRLRRLRQVWRTFHLYSWCLFERYERFVPGKSFETRIEGEGEWVAIQGSTQGFVLATAHIGMWEVASTLAPSSGERSVHLVREQELDPHSQRFARGLLEDHAGRGYQTHFASRDPTLGARLLTALRAGALVALQGDRPRSGGKVHEARLFGRRMLLPPGPAALARSADVPILPVFAYREGRRRNVVVFRPRIESAHSSDRSADLARTVDALALEIEGAIRRAPNQWFCFAEAFLPEESRERRLRDAGRARAARRS